METLKDCKVAILVANGFEQVELTEPRKALEQAGAITYVISPEENGVRGWNHTEWGETIAIDYPLDSADPTSFDALLLPGGVMNPDRLRMLPRAVQFVRSFLEDRKPVASICHGPWLLVEADAVRGRRCTSYPSIRTDMINAGADWVDEETVLDDGVLTSRRPSDIPAFNRAMLEQFASRTDFSLSR